MSEYPRGTVAFAADPFEVHDTPRPVVVISPEDRPFGHEESTVVCLGTDADERYDPATPRLPDDLVDGLSFHRPTYVLPWALYTIPNGTIDERHPMGQLEPEGVKLIAEAIYRMLRT